MHKFITDYAEDINLFLLDSEENISKHLSNKIQLEEMCIQKFVI